MTEKKQRFWTSIQGIITAIAGLITAITGLVIAINGFDFSPLEPTSTTPAQVVETTPAVQTTTVQMQVTRQEQGESLSQPIENTGQVAKAKPLLDCSLFPTVNTVDSLMSWSNYYHKKVIAAGTDKAAASSPCDKSIGYRGMAHCKAPNNIAVRQALFETLSHCREAGIEWTEIKRSVVKSTP